MEWKELLTLLIRYGMIALAGVLVSRNIISQELADRLADSGTAIVCSAVLFAAAFGWRYLVKRYNLKVLAKALRTTPGTASLKEIKQEVWQESKTGTVLPL